MTIVVTVVCLLVYWAQERNEQRIVAEYLRKRKRLTNPQK